MTHEEFTKAYCAVMNWTRPVVHDENLPLEYPVCVYNFADGQKVTAICEEIPLDAVPEDADLPQALDALFDMDEITAQYESVHGFYADSVMDGEDLPQIENESALHALLDALDEDDRARGEVTMDDDFTACIMKDGCMTAAAGAVLEGGRIADISLCVHPGMRGSGLGKRIARALIAKIQQAGYIPLYRTEDSNEASVKLARSIGLAAGFIMDGAQIFFPEEE